MEELSSIFEKLELKKQLIIKYEEEFEKLNNQKDKLTSKEFNSLYKRLVKSCRKEMKSID